ncbi:2-dehydropantoate 2-reductase [Pseudalkalibacillus sp. SCS-8]|uniref:2-dehydropantoate 2-reductase n=1 Tax=Pseudalkalibacillus nanhaiensis TaxID=3115291 RepID=UPI0032DA9FBB
MKIGIVGGGSVGLLFASYLLKDGHEVVVYVRRKEQQRLLEKNGLDLHTPNGTFTTYPVVQVLEDAAPSQHDLLILAVKSYQIDNLISVIHQKFEKAKTILFIQNGMYHLRRLDEFTRHSIFLGVVEHGTMKESDHAIHHTGIGRTKIAPYIDGHTGGVDWNRLSTPDFEFIKNDDWYDMLSRKLHINSVINPLTAILGVRNGQLLENGHWCDLMKRLSRESCRVLKIPEQEGWKDLLAVCKNTSINKSSMLRDLEMKRRTELEAINGFLLEMAEQQQMSIPNHFFVYQLVKGMEGEMERGEWDG